MRVGCPARQADRVYKRDESRRPRLLACARPRLERSADLTVSNASGADLTWSPRHGHEPGARGVPVVPADPPPRSRRPAVAGPGPVRAVLRALQPHPVPAALPVRVRADPGG